MSYRFSLVKTAYHTGVLEVSVDFGSSILEPINDQRSAVLHRVLWDITMQDVLVVDVPYVHTTHFREFVQKGIGAGSPILPGPAIFVKAITSLGHTSNVGSTIRILIEHWSEDMKVAWPFWGLLEVAGAEALEDVEDPKGKNEEKDFDKIYPQMFGFDKGTDSSGGPFDPGNRTHALSKTVLLGPSTTAQSEELALRMMAGDVPTNLRLVLKRFYRTGSYAITPHSETAIFSPNNPISWPAYMRSLRLLFVHGYGGYRLKIALHGTGTLIGPVELRATTNSTGDGNAAEPRILQANSDNVIAEVTVPNVSPYPYYVLSSSTAFNVNVRGKVPFSYIAKYVSLADDASWGGINYLPSYSYVVPAAPLAAPYEIN